MFILDYGLQGLALAYTTWTLYLAIVGVVNAWYARRISHMVVLLALPLLATGVVADVLLNATLGTLLFWERPHEWVLTLRCDRLMQHGTPRQANLAAFICKNFLDPFQVGGHCVKVKGENA